MNDKPHYSMVIEWDPRGDIYVVSFPEWEAAGTSGHTHGGTYEEAVRKGHDVLEFMIESALEEGESLPQPRTFVAITR